jgi:hypothetical protein
VIDFGHCGVEYHASFPKQSLSSTLEKSLAVTILGKSDVPEALLAKSLC